MVDCGTQMHAANAAAVELADRTVLLTTPDVISVRGAKRMVRLWDRLQIRKAEETLTVVNRASRHTEIQPQLVSRVIGTPVARTTVPAHFKELQSRAGRRPHAGPGRQGQRAAGACGASPANWAWPRPPARAGGAARTPGPRSGGRRRGRSRQGRGAGGGTGADGGSAGPGHRALPPGGGDQGALTVEFAGMAPIVLVTLALLWQCVLIGYTFSLAGNAADEAARAATGAAAYGDPQGACETAAREHLPAKWRAPSSISCCAVAGCGRRTSICARRSCSPARATSPSRSTARRARRRRDERR